MGPHDCTYTWHSEVGPFYRSRLDRFLCSVELLELYLEADVLALPRPISDLGRHMKVMDILRTSRLTNRGWSWRCGGLILGWR